MTERIDINCDLGEGAANDEFLMRVVTSANIACGAHAGDETTIRRCITLALRHGVAIGAHPGYADRVNFGRLPVPMSPHEITDLVADQLRLFRTLCDKCGATLSHVKPHGALYNLAWVDRDVADAIVLAVVRHAPGAMLYAPSGSALTNAGDRAGLRGVAEIFADRTYRTDRTLSPRSDKGALRDDPSEAAAVVLRALRTGLMPTLDGGDVRVTAETVCVHGDHPGAPTFATRLRAALAQAGVRVIAPGVV